MMDAVDSIIKVPNDRLLEVMGKKMCIRDSILGLHGLQKFLRGGSAAAMVACLQHIALQVIAILGQNILLGGCPRVASE